MGYMVILSDPLSLVFCHVLPYTDLVFMASQYGCRSTYGYFKLPHQTCSFFKLLIRDWFCLTLSSYSIRLPELLAYTVPTLQGRDIDVQDVSREAHCVLIR